VRTAISLLLQLTAASGNEANALKSLLVSSCALIYIFLGAAISASSEPEEITEAGPWSSAGVAAAIRQCRSVIAAAEAEAAAVAQATATLADMARGAREGVKPVYQVQRGGWSGVLSVSNHDCN
jgi:hypothetical protein